MISDVLFDAIDDIKQYQRDMPNVYAAIKPRIDVIVDQMEALRRDLDNPDFKTHYGDCSTCDGYVLNASEAPFCPSCARERNAIAK